MISFLKKSFNNEEVSATEGRAYLDFAGATPVSEKAKAEMIRSLSVFGNPSGIYKEGVEAKKELENSRKKIANILNARAHEIYFTGTGTESCNLAVVGTYLNWKKENEHINVLPHIIISSIEHPAVMEVVNYLVINNLANVTYLPVYENGLVKVEDVRKSLTPQTILVSVMYANNEIGTVQPIKEIGRMLEEVKSLKSKVESESTSARYTLHATRYPIFHTDACQAPNYLNLDCFRLKADMMTVNSSKVYGPKGIALLYKKENVKLEPVILGGGQERNLRSGTESVTLINSFAVALEESVEMQEKESSRLKIIRDKFKNELTNKIPETKFYGDFTDRLPNNINFRVAGIPSDEMIIRLSEKGFAVSHKSTCASSVDDASYVIRALGATVEEAKENIRVTMGRETTEGDMSRLIDAIVEIKNKYAK